MAEGSDASQSHTAVPTTLAVDQAIEGEATEQEQRDAAGLPGTFVLRDKTEIFLDASKHIVPPRPNADLLRGGLYGPGLPVMAGAPVFSGGMAHLLRGLLPREVQGQYGLVLPPETVLARVLAKAMARYKKRHASNFDMTLARHVEGKSWAQVAVEFGVSAVAVRTASEHCLSYLLGAVEQAVDESDLNEDEVGALHDEAARRGIIELGGDRPPHAPADRSA